RPGRRKVRTEGSVSPRPRGRAGREPPFGATTGVLNRGLTPPRSPAIPRVRIVPPRERLTLRYARRGRAFRESDALDLSWNLAGLGHRDIAGTPMAPCPSPLIRRADKNRDTRRGGGIRITFPSDTSGPALPCGSAA